VSRLYAIDASALAAYKHFSVSDVSAHADMIDGVRLWWLDFVSRYRPARAVACLDCSRETNWRKIRYAEYKSGRDSRPKDEALISGMRQLPSLFTSLRVPTLRVDGYEADDLIATFSARHDGEVIIVTNDKDLLQLVDDRVRVYNLAPNKAGDCVFYDFAAVEQKHGVPPHRLREYLAIKGDSADSIPGIKGLGDVFARTAIRQTRSKAELIRKASEGALNDITAAKQAYFTEHLADFNLSFELVGLKFDAPIAEDFNTAFQQEKAE